MARRRWKGGWTLLPILPGGQEGGCYNISADGQTVVGFTDDASFHRLSCYWTPDGGPFLLSSDSGSYGSAAFGVSGDGSMIVGSASAGYYWTAATGQVNLDTVSQPWAISAYGNRIAGDNYSGPDSGKICYWDVPGFTKTNIPNPPGYHGASAFSISRDGSVIVGSIRVSAPIGNTPTDYERPFRWTAATGIVPIDIGNAQWARGFGVSGDGLIVIGDMYDPTVRPTHNQHGSYTWTQAGGLIWIPPEDPDENHGVYGYYAISDDGSTIQSYGWWPNLNNDYGNHIALTRGTQRIIPTPPYLDPTVGLNEQGMYPSGLSHDGNVMCGYGDNGTSFANVGPWVFALGNVVDAELFFNPQHGFLDFSNPANRRLFVSPEGTPQWIGGHGNAPFQSAAAVYLSTLSPQRPHDFTINNGFGGSFPVSGEIDPGSPLPGCSFSEVDYVVGDAPSAGWRLSVSDDGSRTWSTLTKPRAVGVTGQYRKRLRWLKMGQFRQRSLKLECTDPVRRNIKGIYIDTDQGMK